MNVNIFLPHSWAMLLESRMPAVAGAVMHQLEADGHKPQRFILNKATQNLVFGVNI